MEGANPAPPAGGGNRNAPRNPPLQTSVRLMPFLVFSYYVGVATYYFYIRFTKTLDVPAHPGYAYFVLAVELLGVTAFLPYAMLLWRSTLSNKTSGLPSSTARNAELLDNCPRFQVHVLIPCYKEDLEVVSATVLAAVNADLPPFCTRTVYLCDDGAAVNKQEFIHGLQRSDVLYVSGRVRKGAEMNGKSANLNNCLKKVIYRNLRDRTIGDIPKSRHLDISSSDIIVVFDADMVCKKTFFCKVLEVMEDDRVGLCVTPQAFHNINPDSDLFNAVNKQFWEYVLPGCDACGYIGCTGTNFALRARAIASVGWFPEFSITEDYALGMELAKSQWIGRYMNEYLAEGEAPDEPRNVFRQRSRWTKGHMQVFFSERCPLFNFHLTMVNRLLYANGTWSYIVNSIAVPVFILVPFLSAVCNIHPLVINKEFVLAATLHYVAMLWIQFYCRHPSHITSLWFSQLSNHVLWFTYTKAFYNALLSQLHLKHKMTFKATDKTSAPAAPPRPESAGALQRMRNIAHDMSLRASSLFRPGTANTNRTGTPQSPGPSAMSHRGEEDEGHMRDKQDMDDGGVFTLNHIRLDMDGKSAAANRYGGPNVMRGYPASEQPSAPPMAAHDLDAVVQLATPPRTPADLPLMAAGYNRPPSSNGSGARGSPATPWRQPADPVARGSPPTAGGMLPMPPADMYPAVAKPGTAAQEQEGSPNLGGIYLQRALSGGPQSHRINTPTPSRPTTSPPWNPSPRPGTEEGYNSGMGAVAEGELQTMPTLSPKYDYVQFNQTPVPGNLAPAFDTAAADQHGGDGASGSHLVDEDMPKPSCTEMVVSKLYLGGTWDAYVLVVSLLLSVATILAGSIRTATASWEEGAVFSVLPIFWAANNAIPPYLFLHYCFTKGDTFDWACSVCRMLTVVFSALAIATLWAAVYTLV